MTRIGNGTGETLRRASVAVAFTSNTDATSKNITLGYAHDRTIWAAIGVLVAMFAIG